jgi:hypothetical protein
MAKRGPKPALTAQKKTELLAIVGVGISQTEAAKTVGVDQATIRRTCKADAEFATAYMAARSRGKIRLLGSMYAAAQGSGDKGGDWRAAGWLLERMHPDEFGRRHPAAYTRDQILALCMEIADIIRQFVPREQQSEVKTRMQQVIASMEAKHNAT